jgi:hypothetical protein
VRHVGEDHGVAVGCRGGDQLGADNAVRARPVVDEDRLAEGLGQALSQHARKQIVAATRRVRDDDADRPVRKIVRAARECWRDEATQREEPPPKSFPARHVRFSHGHRQLQD